MLVNRVNAMFIASFWIQPELVDWKSTILIILRKQDPHQ